MLLQVIRIRLELKATILQQALPRINRLISTIETAMPAINDLIVIYLLNIDGRSPFFIEVGGKIDSDGWAVVPWDVSFGVRVHCVDVVVGEVHHNNLGISCLGPRSHVPPDMLGSDLAVVGHEVILEAGLIVMVSLPDHSLHLGMCVTKVPVGIIVDLELSLSVFDDPVGVVDT